MEISIRGGGQTRFLYPQFIQKCIKFFLLGGVPLEKKNQGSPLWIFWENFQNSKKISNNKKIPRVPLLDILGKKYLNFKTHEMLGLLDFGLSLEPDP